MTAIYLDLPVGTQRVLHEAADQCHMGHQAFIRMLLNEAADYLLERDPDHLYFDLKRIADEVNLRKACSPPSQRISARDPEESNQGEPIEEQYPQTSTRQKDREGARSVPPQADGGRSLATDTKQ